jgi:hypothetical protein
MMADQPASAGSKVHGESRPTRGQGAQVADLAPRQDGDGVGVGRQRKVGEDLVGDDGQAVLACGAGR